MFKPLTPPKTTKLQQLLFLMLIVFTIFLLLFSCYLVSWGCSTQLAGIAVLFTGVWLSIRKKKASVLGATILIWGFISMLFLEGSLESYNKTRDEYMNRIRSGGELSFREKTNVYLLNVYMSLTALPLYPEIGMESLLMGFPSARSERRFESGFFLGSDKIQQKLRRMKPGQTESVVWSAQNYLLGHNEARYSLALNPCRIAFRQEGSTRIYEVRVPVKYPDKSLVTLMAWPVEIRIEEGLFGYLQRVGWMHPYEAVWVHRECVK